MGRGRGRGRGRGWGRGWKRGHGCVRGRGRSLYHMFEG